MKELAKKIASIIADYRNEDDIFIDDNHVLHWVNQSEENDREFLLTELNYILSKSYLSKKEAVDELTDMFNYLAKHYKYDSVTDLLYDVRILSCQPEGKSQFILLHFLDEILKDEYGIGVVDCGNKENKFWLYIDDVLASGGILKKDITNELEKFGISKFEKSSIKIIGIFFFLHSWGQKNSVFALEKALDIKLEPKINFFHLHYIDNDPRIHSYYNSTPAFNLIYSRESIEGKTFLDSLEEKLELKFDMKNFDKAFRPANRPAQENFFSNEVNRNRYEQILLKKGIELFNDIEHIRAKGTRPLGFTPPSYKTLGTGSHAFTWRNISNTCPLVFWWEVNNWYPLFSVANRGK